MKNKFLVSNDIGLALYKVNHVISYIRSEDFDQDGLYGIDDILGEVLNHLQQAYDNVELENI